MPTTAAPPLLRLAEVAAALSLATDLGTGQPLEHALRVCLLSVQLSEALGLSEQEHGDVYYVALLRALGCVADAHQVAARFGDELLANAQISLMDTAQPTDVLAMLLRHVGEGQPALRRARMITAALAAGPGERNHILTAHCEVAELLALRLGVRPTVARGLTQVFERWDGKGSPWADAWRSDIACGASGGADARRRIVPPAGWGGRGDTHYSPARGNAL